MTKQEIMPMSLCDNSINKLTFNNCIQLKLKHNAVKKEDKKVIQMRYTSQESDYNGQSRQCWMQLKQYRMDRLLQQQQG